MKGYSWKEKPDVKLLTDGDTVLEIVKRLETKQNNQKHNWKVLKHEQNKKKKLSLSY